MEVDRQRFSGGGLRHRAPGRASRPARGAAPRLRDPHRPPARHLGPGPRAPGDPPGGHWETGAQPRLILTSLAGEIDASTAGAIEIWLHENTHGASSRLLGVDDAAVTEMMLMCSPVRDHGPARWHRDFSPGHSSSVMGYAEDIRENGPRYVQWNLHPLRRRRPLGRARQPPAPEHAGGGGAAAPERPGAPRQRRADPPSRRRRGRLHPAHPALGQQLLHPPAARPPRRLLHLHPLPGPALPRASLAGRARHLRALAAAQRPLPRPRGVRPARCPRRRRPGLPPRPGGAAPRLGSHGQAPEHHLPEQIGPGTSAT